MSDERKFTQAAYGNVDQGFVSGFEPGSIGRSLNEIGVTICNQLRRVRVADRNLLALLRGRLRFTGLPPDAVVVHSTPAPQYEGGGLMVTVRSKTYEPVADGREIPIDWDIGVEVIDQPLGPQERGVDVPRAGFEPGKDR